MKHKIKAIKLSRYSSNEALAVLFVVSRDDIAVVSINMNHGQALESRDLATGEFFFHYTDFPELQREALERGLIEVTTKSTQSGHGHYPVMRITDAGKALVKHGFELLDPPTAQEAP
jgi:hypothetical protein